MPRPVVFPTKKKKLRFFKPPPEEFPADFLERIDLPRIPQGPTIPSRYFPTLQRESDGEDFKEKHKK